MKSDKDRPSTWKVYRQGMCDTCAATCCTMPVEVRWEDLERLKLVSPDEAHLSRKKILRKLHSKGLVQSYREATGLFMLQHKPNGDCVFLNSESRKCTVYSERPDVCRDFPYVGPRINWCPHQSR